MFADQDLTVAAEANFCISHAASTDYAPSVPGDFLTSGGDLDTWTAVVISIAGLLSALSNMFTTLCNNSFDSQETVLYIELSFLSGATAARMQ